MNINLKNTLISILITSALLGFVIFLCNLATDSDFGGFGYIFLLIFFGFIAGLIAVFLRLICLIDTRSLLYNFVGTFNLTIAFCFFVWGALAHLLGSIFSLTMPVGIIFFCQFLIGAFILVDIYIIDRIWPEK